MRSQTLHGHSGAFVGLCIIIVDGGSTDHSRDIAESFPKVEVIHRPFDSHSAQWNFGLDQVDTEWTLAFDADYFCSPSLVTELEAMAPLYDAYEADFTYTVMGRPLRGTLYPPRVVLFKTKAFRYVQDGHTQLLDLRGTPCGKLRSKIVHDDRKPLGRWLQAQAKYAVLEANKMLAAERSQLRWKDRLRRGIVWAPPLTLVYCLFWKLLILDGWRGIYYSLQRTYAELLLSLELLDRRLRQPVADDSIGSDQ